MKGREKSVITQIETLFVIGFRNCVACLKYKKKTKKTSTKNRLYWNLNAVVVAN